MNGIPGIKNMTDMPGDALARLLLLIAGVFVGAIILVLAVSLLEYIFRGLALYRMSKYAGYPSPVLAWVPVANSYLLGLLCERSSCRRTGRTWKFSVILPVMELLILFCAGSARRMSFLYSTSLLDNRFSLSLGGLLGLAGTVVTAFALYNLYWDYAQGREVLYIVLSVVFGGLGQAIILFTLRNRVPLSVQYPQYPQDPQYPLYPQYPQGPGGPEDHNL